MAVILNKRPSYEDAGGAVQILAGAALVVRRFGGRLREMPRRLVDGGVGVEAF